MHRLNWIVSHRSIWNRVQELWPCEGVVTCDLPMSNHETWTNRSLRLAVLLVLRGKSDAEPSPLHQRTWREAGELYHMLPRAIACGLSDASIETLTALRDLFVPSPEIPYTPFGLACYTAISERALGFIVLGAILAGRDVHLLSRSALDEPARIKDACAENGLIGDGCRFVPNSAAIALLQNARFIPP